MLQKDIHYNKLNKSQARKHNFRKYNKYDRLSLLIEDEGKSKNSKSQKKRLVRSQPQYNPSVHKNISDQKENNWLFSPTRIEIDHNY